MRLPKHWVPLIAKKIVGDLLSMGLIETRVPLGEVIAHAEGLIMDELMVEDRVNEETREILKTYSDEIERGRLDYRKMFELTKRKIVREKGLIL
jgi:hypothetical protein